MIIDFTHSFKDYSCPCIPVHGRGRFRGADRKRKVSSAIKKLPPKNNRLKISYVLIAPLPFFFEVREAIHSATRLFHARILSHIAEQDKTEQYYSGQMTINILIDNFVPCMIR